MYTVIVATGELQQTIFDLLDPHGAIDHEDDPIHAVARLVTCFNRCQYDDLIDGLINLLEVRLTDYAVIDYIAAEFTRLIDQYVQPAPHRFALEYDYTHESLLIFPRERNDGLARPVARHQPPQRPPLARDIKEEYQHAQSQGDYYPERLRRAFEELSAGL